MKYCHGNCRTKCIKIEKTTKNCPYNRSYIIDKQKDNNKYFEICIKKSLLENLISYLWKIFFPDLVNLNVLKNNSRLSKTVIKNREIAFKNRGI
jgi:hypothetical protein